MVLRAEAPPSVLLVEDDAELLSLVHEFLEEEGYRVTPASSLPASLTALEERFGVNPSDRTTKASQLSHSSVLK